MEPAHLCFWLAGVCALVPTLLVVLKRFPFDEPPR
jgi:hypothetical protein